MQELKKFKTLTPSRREYISNSVAIHWLTNAEAVIARGGSPMKFSIIARQQINNVLGDLPECDLLPSSAGITRMTNNSIKFALYLLRNGRFPTVAKHFSQPNNGRVLDSRAELPELKTTTAVIREAAQKAYLSRDPVLIEKILTDAVTLITNKP